MVEEQLQRSMSRSSRHTRELARKFGKLTEAQAVIGWGLILLVIALLGVIYLNQSSRIAAVGRRVQILQIELNTIQRENANLERDIASAQDISRINKEADQMGFIKAQPQDTDYLVVPKYPPLAEVSELDAQAPVEPLTVESMKEAFWLVFESEISDLMQGESLEQ
jgi:hypothetical protein